MEHLIAFFEAYWIQILAAVLVLAVIGEIVGLVARRRWLAKGCGAVIFMFGVWATYSLFEMPPSRWLL